MNTVEVIYDGRAFVPTKPVQVPTGTRSIIELPDHGYPGPLAGAPNPDHPLTPEDEAIWIEFMNTVRSSPPNPPTFDEYLRQQRSGE